MAGANLIYGLGMLESGVTFDFGQLVMDSEFARMIKHCVAGIRVDDESLMVDEVHAVGAFGDFLSRDSTLRHMREQSQPRLLDRKVREDWRLAGETTLLERATAEAVRILDSHVPEPLTPDAAAAIRAIVEDAERELGVE